MKTIKEKRSLRFSILLRFCLVLAIVFTLMWILQVLFYDSIYQAIKTNKAKKINSEISKYYEQDDMSSLFDLSMENDCSIVIFYFVENELDEITTEVVFSTLRAGDDKMMGKSLGAMITKLGDDTSVEFEEEKGGVVSLTYGERKLYNNEDMYIYSSTIVTPTDSTVEVIMFMLMIITIFSLIIAIIVSVLFSNSLSKPLVSMSDKAKQLSKGNLKVKFEGGQYQELDDLARTLNYSIGEIKKSQDIEREVIQNVSHELRTPLTMIKSYTELIEDYSGDDKQKRHEHLQIILQEADRLNTLVNDMLDLSKMQAKTILYEKSEFDLVESLKKFEVYYKKEFEQKGFSFTFSYPKSYTLVADRVRIEQVVTNLINNAINYSRDDKRISVSLIKNQDGVGELSVQDHGVGISQEDQKKIFQRHFRAISTKRAVVGSGIGLTIVKEVLDYHGFSYGVESKIDKGSKFFVKFC